MNPRAGGAAKRATPDVDPRRKLLAVAGLGDEHSLTRATVARVRATLSVATDLDPAAAERALRIVEDALTRLEEELASRTREVVQQRHLMERVIDALPVGLYVVDRQYRVQAWNHARETGLQGISRGETLGRTIFEILHRQSAESLRRGFDEVFETGELRQFETETTTTAGAPGRTFRISKIPMRLDGGEVTHVITVGEDVTSWNAAQGRIAQSEKLAAIGQLVAGVMHEINNPLATIAACAESVAGQLQPAEAQGTAAVVPQGLEYLRVIDTEVRRCKGIIDALLDFGRARPLVREPLDLNAVIEQTIFLLKHHQRFRRRTVRLELDRGLGPLLGSAEQLVQVFMALLHNAADAVEERVAAGSGSARRAEMRGRSTPRSSHRVTPAATRLMTGGIHVRTRRGTPAEGGTQIVAEVIDEGMGIPAAARAKIFEPFFTTKPVGRGTGLGLSVCYGIVAEHGARMEVDSEVGAGSTFRIIFSPAASEPEATSAASPMATGISP